MPDSLPRLHAQEGRDGSALALDPEHNARHVVGTPWILSNSQDVPALPSMCRGPSFGFGTRVTRGLEGMFEHRPQGLSSQIPPSLGLGGHLRTYISNKFRGNAEVAGAGTTVGGPLLQGSQEIYNFTQVKTAGKRTWSKKKIQYLKVLEARDRNIGQDPVYYVHV